MKQIHTRKKSECGPGVISNLRTWIGLGVKGHAMRNARSSMRITLILHLIQFLCILNEKTLTSPREIRFSKQEDEQTNENSNYNMMTIIFLNEFRKKFVPTLLRTTSTLYTQNAINSRAHTHYNTHQALLALLLSANFAFDCLIVELKVEF